jgi:RNA polymerase sigma-70 factor (ECF subfamily)
MDMSDSQLAALAGKGDADAYRQLFERYQHPIYNFVYRLVENAEDASDITQDAFIKMYGVLGERDIQNFSAYLYRTAKNLAYDEMRRRSRFADVDHELLAPEDPNIYADPQRALLLGEQMGQVRQAASRLSENHRAALILRELEDLDYDSMSEVLESNRNAVGALLSRARLRFREELRMAQLQTEECPPECEEIIAMLSPYIDGELTAAEKEKADSHIEHCTFCAAALDEMREASRSFRLFIPVVPPAEVAQAFTGRLQDLTGQEASADATRAYPRDTAPTRRSLASRILHSKTTWIAGAAVCVFAVSMFLLAEEAGLDLGNPGITTATNADTTANTASSTVPADVGSTATSPDNGNAQDHSQTGQAGGTPGPDTLSVSVLSGYVTPNPVYELQNATYVATVSGDARSVSVKLVSAGSGLTLTKVPLSMTSEGAGQQTWGATSNIGSDTAGTYEIYVIAVDGQGQQDSKYVGTLVIKSTLY